MSQNKPLALVLDVIALATYFKSEDMFSYFYFVLENHVARNYLALAKIQQSSSIIFYVVENHVEGKTYSPGKRLCPFLMFFSLRKETVDGKDLPFHSSPGTLGSCF